MLDYVVLGLGSELGFRYAALLHMVYPLSAR